MGRPRRFTEDEVREAIAVSRSWAETLRQLKYKSAGGNWKTLKKYAALWQIDTSHFDSLAASLEGLRLSSWKKRPLEEILVAGSTYSRSHLKRRLYDEGLKEPRCELCGQDENWNGAVMALILDHINGVPDDHRLENLRIVCPNCDATLETHCGRHNRKPRPVRECRLCGATFTPNSPKQRYCSRECGQRVGRIVGIANRRVKRPPYEQLRREIQETSYLAAGRKYGVSDNAVRKWVRQYEREAELAEQPADLGEAA
jgi:hypothetical protein